MTLPLQGLSAVVTGAGRGLGRVEALELARLGAAVVVNDYGRPGRDGTGDASAGPAEQVVAEIRDTLGGTALAHTGDVADCEQAGELVELAIRAFGKLDILVNNAGILRDRMIFSMTEDEWDSVLRVHLKGHFNTTRSAAAHWRRRAKAAGEPVYGRIINTSSEAFLAGSAGQPNYAAAKGGIVGLTTSTALALAKYGVTANAICPRARTRMTEDVFAGLKAPDEGWTRSPPSMSPRSSATWPHRPPPASADSCSWCTAAWWRSSNGPKSGSGSTASRRHSPTTNSTRCSPRTTRGGRRGDVRGGGGAGPETRAVAPGARKAGRGGTLAGAPSSVHCLQAAASVVSSAALRCRPCGDVSVSVADTGPRCRPWPASSRESADSCFVVLVSLIGRIHPVNIIFRTAGGV